MRSIKNILTIYDPIILLIVIFLIFWSILNVYSATFHEYSNLYIKQAVFGVIGLTVMLLLPFIDYRKVLNLSPYLYLIGIILLLGVMLFGKTILGAKRWINLGFFMLQPSELMKFIMILITAHLLDDKKSISLKDISIVLIITAIPLILILKQPDLGTSIMVLLPVLVILFTAGLPKRYIFGAIGLFISLAPFIWQHMKEYQKKRILAFLNPEADPFGSAYHILQSKIAVGSGQLTGKGFLEGTQSKLFFLPEQHTDFIFATIGEEWGFLMSALIVLLYLILGIRIVLWGLKIKHIAGKYVCFGSAGLITLQAFINISMTVGFAPVVGITLPLISYGGTSLITFCLIIGLVLSVIAEYKREKIHF
ncbi:MAG: rod shape-determining protein RodA [Persephonella sp.]|nr:MAG: rod shape-determining protein RodA [Persephonella sp.]RUM62502.1 MAG: rod shape-determining protein RodA [Persephonella sp.]